MSISFGQVFLLDSLNQARLLSARLPVLLPRDGEEAYCQTGKLLQMNSIH
jgi:hypothetical protein